VGELRFSVANIDAARKAFGFNPTRTLDADLDQVIRSIQGQRGS
jgi:hypothetical protein